jgi:arylsulfatase A-like enzyme
METTVTERMWAGAIDGFEVWGWYALWEYLCTTLYALANPKYDFITPNQWRASLLLFAVYAGIGIALGIVSACAIPGLNGPGRRLRKSLILSLIVAFLLNSSFADLPGRAKAATLVGTILIGTAAAFDWGRSRKRPGLGGDPAAASALLILAGWLGQRSLAALPSIVFVCAVAAVVLALIALALAAERWQESAKSWFAGIPRFHVLTNSTVVLALSLPILTIGPILLLARAGQPDSQARVPGSSATRRPNVILITLDTVRADHLGIYGYRRKNTPNLQTLLNGSTLYDRFIAATPFTLSSHASIFTGLYAQSHGSHISMPEFPQGRPLPANIPTLAELLASAGYQTLGIAANTYYLTPDWGLNRGFEYWSTPKPVPLLSYEQGFYLRNRIRRLPILEEEPGFDQNTISAEEVTRRACAGLDHARLRGAPFFLFLNYMDAHRPYIPPAPYDRLYPGRKPAFTRADYNTALEGVDRTHPINPDVRSHLVSQYDGAIAYLDSQLGALFAYLKANSLWDNTILIVTADHGETFGERGYVGHNVSVYQDQVHVPLIVKYPDQSRADRVGTLGSHVDLMPTILEAVKLPAPAGIEGLSLMHPEGLSGRAVAAEFYKALEGSPEDRAVFAGDQKLILAASGSRELYDLSNDPSEADNLYRSDSPEGALLARKLQEWNASSRPHYAVNAPMDRQKVNALRGLGYAQ